VLAKAAFLAGPVHGPALLAAVGADGLLVDDQGGLHATTGFGRFTAARGPGRVLQEVAG
jgi:hypothetical protein